MPAVIFSVSEGEAGSPLWTERMFEKGMVRGLPSTVTFREAVETVASEAAPSLVWSQTVASLARRGRATRAATRRGRMRMTFLY